VQDQHGCRYLQRKLEEDPRSCNIVFDEMIDDIVALMSGMWTHVPKAKDLAAQAKAAL
jgi:hypothetical protein